MTALPESMRVTKSSKLCFSSITVSADVMQPLQAKQSLREILTDSSGGFVLTTTCFCLTGRRLAAEFLLRETTQSCEGAIKSLRSDACSAGENLLEDIAGDGPVRLVGRGGFLFSACRMMRLSRAEPSEQWSIRALLLGLLYPVGLALHWWALFESPSFCLVKSFYYLTPVASNGKANARARSEPRGKEELGGDGEEQGRAGATATASKGLWWPLGCGNYAGGRRGGKGRRTGGGAGCSLLWTTAAGWMVGG